MKIVKRTKSIIFAMSEPRKKVISELSSGSEKVWEHLLKLYCYPENDSYGHWVDEVYAFLHSVPKLKNSNKYPDKKSMMQYTYGSWEDAIDDRVYGVLEDYPKILWTGRKSCDFHNKVFQYFDLLTTEFQYKGYASKSEVREMLKDAGF